MLHVLLHRDDEDAQGKAQQKEDVDQVHDHPGQQQSAGAANTGNNLMKRYSWWLQGCIFERTCRSKLIDYYKEALETIAAIETAENNLKELKSENRKLSEKVENKSLEIKLKSDIETEKKEKSVLSVALKSSRKETKEQSREFEKKIVETEKKLAELNNFRIKKMAEEREEKQRRKKELKKIR